ncbi:MAG: aspartate aminotransferase family protein [Chloroflexota bacterium]|nr:aspartate aminotransferase family protein [Chloroflexota bacterium]
MTQESSLPHAASAALFDRARQVIPGGVNTSLRKVEPQIVWSRAEGAYLYDVDGNAFLDYHAAFGPIILGHAHPGVAAGVAEQQRSLDLIGVGTSELEIRAAEKIVEHVPSAEQVLFCTSGSEATYHAVRVARGATGRRAIVKFQGHFHGWHDHLLANVISPPDRLGGLDPLSSGILPDVHAELIVLEWNDLEGLERVMAERGREIAAVILEPIPHAIGVVMPEQEFFTRLRALTREHGVVLVFDEVVTGFRHALGGYQAISGITPDLTTLGKAMANGYPCAAICGRRDLMQHFNTSDGDVFFSGTFNGHPLTMAACLATIEALEEPGLYERLFALGERMRSGLEDIIERLGMEAFPRQFGSVFVTYFMSPPANSYRDLLRNDDEMYLDFHRGMLDRGFYMLPMALKRNHISASHTESDIDRTLEAADEVLTALAHGRPVTR